MEMLVLLVLKLMFLPVQRLLSRFEILLAMDFLGSMIAGSGLTASVKVSFVGGGERILKIL